MSCEQLFGSTIKRIEITCVWGKVRQINWQRENTIILSKERSRYQCSYSKGPTFQMHLIFLTSIFVQEELLAPTAS